MHGAWWLAALVGLELLLGGLHIALEETAIFDFDAYMEQASMIMQGQLNYSAVRGDTGPLVYPAGHVAVYAGIHAATRWNVTHWTTEYEPKAIPGYEQRVHRPAGTIFALQLLFLALYAALTGLHGAGLVQHTGLPWWLWLLVVLARRSRTVFVLGLFNDGVAAVCMAAALLAMSRRRWSAGCVAFSLAVSVKMNNLLFAPGVAFLLLHYTGPVGCAWHILQCAAVQGVLAAPFLATFPLQYIAGAFNLGRMFDPQWSVNFRFLPDAYFSSKPWALVLLCGQLAMLAWFAARRWAAPALATSAPAQSHVIDGLPCTVHGAGEDSRGTLTVRVAAHGGSPCAGVVVHLPPGAGVATLQGQGPLLRRLVARHILFVLATSNVIGVVFARSLHFQFLVWYWHCSLFLLACAAQSVHWAAPLLTGLLLLLGWDEHPPQPWSAALVASAHVALLGLAWVGVRTPVPDPLAYRGPWSFAWSRPMLMSKSKAE